MIVGLIHQDWSQGAAVVHPFKLGDSVLSKPRKAVEFKVMRKKHLLETALAWHAKKAANTHIQAVDIAYVAGLSPCRVRQILRFALLHKEIQNTILELAPKQARKRFPERLLRQWIPLPKSEQLSHFKAYVDRIEPF